MLRVYLPSFHSFTSERLSHYFHPRVTSSFAHQRTKTVTTSTPATDREIQFMAKSMAGCGMDVDPPLPPSSIALKRSSSAPMINVGAYEEEANEHHELLLPQLFGNQPRARRFSASFSPSSRSPQSPMPFRIHQIKHEEGMDVVNREVAHEREVQSALQMSLSCEDLTLTETFLPEESKPSVMEPLHIFASPVATCASLSPTRSRKCYSPSMLQSVRSPNPSPTRRNFFRRSVSPIALRPSQLPTKRKCELDERDGYCSPAKRFHSSFGVPERNLLSTHPLVHSLSSSSLEGSTSPEQMVPVGRMMGTPESVSSNDSMCSIFKTVDQDANMNDSAPSTPGSPLLQDSTT